MPETPKFEFPSQEAKDAKLFLPKVYDPYQSDESPRKCYFRFDDKHNALVLVADDGDGDDGNNHDSGEILDILSVDDVIGASVEVDLLGSDNNHSSSNTEPRVASKAAKNDDKDQMFTVVNSESNDTTTNAPKSPIPLDTQATAKLMIYIYPRTDPSKNSMVTSCTGNKQKTKPVKEFPFESSSSSSAAEKKAKLLHRYPHHRSFQIAPAEDLGPITALVKAIRKLARPTSTAGTTERLLVIVNPFSGTKKGMEIYKNIVVPMLEQAGIDHDSVITTHAGHAEEQMAPKDGKGSDGISDISKYDGLVAIGGDGSVYEVMQGIKKRDDCDAILKNLKLGHIGAGTSNGLSASLAHASHEHFTATDYTFIVAKGNTVPMDLSRYETSSSSYLSFLTFSWSLIADIDIESEVLRWMGWLRMEVYSAWRVLNLRSYRAKLSYLPPTTTKLTELPPLSSSLMEEDGWVTMEDDFCLFWVSQVTHAGEAMLNHPQCEPGDGIFHIFLVRKTVSRYRMALILLALEHGTHVNMDAAEFIDCTAYRLEPISSGSYNDLDGEVIESGPVQGMVLPRVTQAYCNL